MSIGEKMRKRFIAPLLTAALLNLSGSHVYGQESKPDSEKPLCYTEGMVYADTSFMQRERELIDNGYSCIESLTTTDAMLKAGGYKIGDYVSIIETRYIKRKPNSVVVNRGLAEKTGGNKKKKSEMYQLVFYDKKQETK